MSEYIILFWLLLAILLILIEASTFNLITIWFACGAVVAMFVSMVLPESIAIQVGTFLIVSIVIMASIRNIAVRKLKVGATKTNVSSLIGKTAVVTKQIEPYNYGEIKVDGNYWTAKSASGDIIEVNAIVEIVEVSGVKLIVKKTI